MEKIKQVIQDSIDTKKSILTNENIISQILASSKEIIKAYSIDQKVLFCGNGGSAADAQHLSAELSGRFYKDRPPLNSEALHVNTSYLTAVANDYSFSEVYSRLVQGIGNKGDILIALTTSGNSVNVIEAIKMAKGLGMTTICLTGEGGGQVSDICDIAIKVPSKDTPRIQESHIMIGHIICELVEKELFP